MTGQTLPAHEKCIHAGYLMDCEEYERLIARNGQRCELCDIDAEATTIGILRIDHDHAKGRQAVRGLVCDSCNAAMRHVDSGFRKPTDRQAHYLDNPWYLSQMAPEHREWWINRPALSYERRVHRPGGSASYWASTARSCRSRRPLPATHSRSPRPPAAAVDREQRPAAVAGAARQPTGSRATEIGLAATYRKPC